MNTKSKTNFYSNPDNWKVVKDIATLATYKDGSSTKLMVMSFGDRKPKLTVRTWDKKGFPRSGISFEDDALPELVKGIQEYMEEKGENEMKEERKTQDEIIYRSGALEQIYRNARWLENELVMNGASGAGNFVSHNEITKKVDETIEKLDSLEAQLGEYEATIESIKDSVQCRLVNIKRN